MSINTKQVEKIVSGIFNATETIQTGRTSYLRALVNEVQKELEQKGADKAAQTKAVRAVHDAFYEVVRTVAADSVPKGTKDRGVLIDRKCTFARTAASALRRAVAGGADVMSLKAATVTKAALAKLAPPSKERSARSAKVLHRLVESRGAALVALVTELVKSDKDAARADIDAIIDSLTKQRKTLESRRIPRMIPPSDGVPALPH